MRLIRPSPESIRAFDAVKAAGLALPGVESATRYDGAPVLKAGGVFMAGLATHPEAEPATLVFRIDPEERAWLLEEAPAVYYVTDYYRPHPVVLVRLSQLTRDALRDLLSASRQLALKKGRGGRTTFAGRPRVRRSPVR
jgi:hypothetical protein